MTTTIRGRIPRLICASCISSALLISAGATTAIAATQSPTDVPVQQIPRDDSGGSNQGSDSGGSGTSDNGGGDTGSGAGDQSGNGSDTGNQPSDTGDHQPSDTGDHQPSDNAGGNTSNGSATNTHNGAPFYTLGGDQGPGGHPTHQSTGTTHQSRLSQPNNTVKQPGGNAGGASDLYRVCVNAGRQWIFTTPTSGYCGGASTTAHPLFDNETVDQAIQCIKRSVASKAVRKTGTKITQARTKNINFEVVLNSLLSAHTIAEADGDVAKAVVEAGLVWVPAYGGCIDQFAFHAPQVE
ncbi:hypothetical protein [Streptomyces sp. NBC_01483]|uniref:hypothetical protein n=1 Tax=Streptomyces sp. NBC_01483 TaxID=2903883 RepID=UPI002E2F46EC|nr:hypothetical protein [Streptomyces sp. NBC_01483]